MLRRYYYLINLCVTPIETSSGVDNTPNTPHLYTPCAQVCVGSTQLGRMLRPDGSPAETTPDQVSGYLPLISQFIGFLGSKAPLLTCLSFTHSIISINY